ncbi:MAG: radical SAM family heme chaperone HemW [Hespellia sp.]|nr:radical SAM family heme chaperone HemW [Hespellia sp.]
MELYLHVPFCVSKCAYCDFLSAPAEEETIEGYVQAVIVEIHAYGSRYADRPVTSIFFGGGTPSILRGEQLQRLMDALCKQFCIAADAEITMEMNPGTVTKEKLLAYKGAGINRISIGLQSVNDRELRMLGRIHTYAQFLETYEMARALGYENINVDLISAIPGQSVESWGYTLETIIKLNPEHISAYSLIVEEGTPFFTVYGEGETDAALYSPLPDEEAERKMYALTKKIMEQYGYHRYEISNYAKAGYECQHNIGYWNRTDYLGIGLGASSLMDEVRFTRVAELGRYLRLCEQKDGEELLSALTENEEVLTRQAQMEEFMFLGLRMMQGVSKKNFFRCFGQSIHGIYGAVMKRLMESSLLREEGDAVMLTEKGIDVSNQVMSEFLL